MPKLIKNDADHAQALERIERLMQAAPDTPEGEELELLATLVDLYERDRFPIDLPSPIEALKFRMDQAGLNRSDLVPFIGSRSKVSEVLGGKRPLSLRMIRRLHEGLGIPAKVLLGSEKQREEPEGYLPNAMDWNKFPIREMARREWFTGYGASEAVEYSEELLRGIVGSLENAIPESTLLRQHVRSGGSENRHALMAWLARVVHLADRQEIGVYTSGTVDQEYVQKLIALSNLAGGPRLAREFLGGSGIQLVILRHLPQTHLDGAALMTRAGQPIIALTLRYDRLDNFWFTLCHELAHVALHLDRKKPAAFLDDLQVQGGELELEADARAADWLIPPQAWEQSSLSSKPTAKRVRELAASLHISPAIVAGRVRREANNYRILLGLVGSRTVRCQFESIDSGWPS